MTANVVNIQRYSVHDGDGIRTTIFFKGCPLRCAWCHNPETWSFVPQLMVYRERCKNCGACGTLCSTGGAADAGLCTGCGDCVDGCVHNARELAGKAYTAKELIALTARDQPFYEASGGGVTLSGGEAMAQDLSFLTDLIDGLFRKGISVNIDTCGHAPWEVFEAVLPRVDTFLYDLKVMDPEAHRRYTVMDNRLILDNARRLSEAGARVHIRVPLVAEINDTDEEIAALLAFLATIRVDQISLLPYHDLGREKQSRFDREADLPPFSPPAQERIQEIAALLTARGYRAGIGG